MLKVAVIVVGILCASPIATSNAQALAENGLPADELNDDVDEISRSGAAAKAYGVSPVPTRVLPSPGMIRLHDCYACTDCPKVFPNTTYKACPQSADSSKNNKCVVYSEQYKHMDRPWYIRGCASERGNCEDIKRAHAGKENVVKLNFCYECDGEKCNTNGGTRMPSSVAAFFVLVVTPLLAKLTLT